VAANRFLIGKNSTSSSDLGVKKWQ